MKNRTISQRVISLLLSLVLLLGLAPAALSADAMPFSDVSANSWYYPYVRDLHTWGVVNGTSATTFSPQDTVTLGEALKMILRAVGWEEQTPTTTHWASGYYRLADEKKCLPQNPGTLDSSVTRIQIAEITARALGLERTNHGRPFSDTSSIEAMTLSDYGIMTGSTVDGKQVFCPTENITRAEISAVVWRIYKYQNGEDFSLETPAVPVEEPAVQQEPAVSQETTPAQETVTPAEPVTPTEPEETESSPYTPSRNTGETFQFNGKTIYVKEGVKKREYDTSLFKRNEDGFLIYDSKDYISKVGIDVSKYQGTIDWKKVANAGVDFAILRVGYRGYGTGALAADSTFKTNLEGALENGIEVGIYFFSQAITPEEAVEEAEYCLKQIKGYNITYPIVFDWEPYDSSKNARTQGLDDDTLTQCAVAFCERIKKAGYTPMVYSNLTYFYLHFDIGQFAQYPIWLAQYSSKPTFYYHFDMWQYGSEPVDGIEGDVDVNVQIIPRY